MSRRKNVIISLQGVPVEQLSTVEGQRQAAEIFARNEGKLRSLLLRGESEPDAVALRVGPPISIAYTWDTESLERKPSALPSLTLKRPNLLQNPPRRRARPAPCERQRSPGPRPQRP